MLHPYPLPIKERLKYILAAAVFVGLVVVYTQEFYWLSRTIDVKALVIASLLIGLAGGLLWGHLYARREEGLTEKIQLYVFFGVLCMVFAPLAGSLSNRLLSPFPAAVVEVDFVGQEAYYASRSGPIVGEEAAPTGYTIDFYYRQRVRTLKVDAPMADPPERGESIGLLMQKGLWGAVFIQSKPLQ